MIPSFKFFFLGVPLQTFGIDFSHLKNVFFSKIKVQVLLNFCNVHFDILDVGIKTGR
jgi:hypothetical protein